MKSTKLFLPIVLVLVSCAAPAPATLAATQEPTSSISLSGVSGTAPIPVNPDPAMGNIEGNISWLDPAKSTKVPISNVNIELNGHSGSTPRYTTKTDLNGHYTFVNIEPIQYGVGVYFNLPINERVCETPEYLYSKDLDWLHYTTALKGDRWYDILFSNEDVMVTPGEIVVMDFELKCS